MSDQERELMNSYIYEVIRRVSRAQRGEIQLELQELIEDMYEAESEGKMEHILMQLGDPKEFAKKYRDDMQCLIGFEYYDNYKWVLKIVLSCVGGSLILSGVVQLFAHTKQAPQVFLYGMEFISQMMVALITAFGAVTLVFAFLERKQWNVQMKKDKKWTVNDLSDKEVIWTPKQLQQVPDKKSLISRGDCIVGMVFTAIFSGILIFAPQFFGVWTVKDNAVSVIPLFNLRIWHIILPLLLLSLAIGFVDEVIKLVVGHYGMMVMISNIISGGLQIILGFLIIKGFPIWNAKFVTEFEGVFHTKITSTGDLLAYWNTEFVSNVILAIVVGATLLEIVITIYKTLRYSNEVRVIY
ncbi:hypothetical protein ACTQ6A_07830 [Lachnospiraceae bacterium LCP25S3_G4]